MALGTTEVVMAEPEYKTINLEDIRFDLRNPRYDGLSSQLEALQKIIDDQGPKLIRLARDVAEHGVNPGKSVLVEPDGKGGYIILEGNRRLAVLKLLNQPELRTSAGLKDPVARRFKQLAEIGQERVPKTLRCAAMSREDAEHWILLEHTGQNQGAGIVPWDAAAANRFQGGSPTLQAIGLVRPHLDPDTVDELLTEGSTTLRRLLHTADARAALGLEIDGQEFRLGPKKGIALARLVAVAKEIADGTKDSRDLNRVEDRVSYAREIAQRVTTPLTTQSTGKAGGKTTGTGATTDGRARRAPLHRHFVIPKRCKLSVSPQRLNRIYDELQRIRLDRDFVNAGAVLLRVFVELSVDEYGERHGLSFKEPAKGAKGQPSKDRDLALRKKIARVADHLAAANVCNRTHLQGIRAVAADRHHPLAIDSWNAYVHNKHFHPNQRVLTETWDNIEPFMIGVWKK